MMSDSLTKKFGHWQILSVAHRRAVCRCRCGEVREVATSALQDGSSTSCGCAAFSKQQKRTIFDQEKLRRAEKISTNWKLGRGR